MGRFIDLTGKKFGRLTVIRRATELGTKSGIKWVCKCECNRTVVVNGKHLKSGATKTCTECKYSKNTFEVQKDCVVGKDNRGNYFLFDIEDLIKVEKYTWSLNNHGYWVTYKCEENNNKSTSLHRYLLDFPEYIIDHRDRNRNNNKRSNLKEANETINAINHSLSGNNKSGIIGVRKRDTSWIAYIGRRHLGTFKTKDEAIRKRLLEEIKLYGEDISPQRHLFEQYNVKVPKTQGDF